jgi:hypothetical protein
MSKRIGPEVSLLALGTLHRSLRFTGFAAAIIGCCGALACNSLELENSALPSAEEAGSAEAAVIAAEPATPEEQAEIGRDKGRRRCREAVSESELSIRWAKDTMGSRTRMLATIHNNGSLPMTAEPVLIAANSVLGEVRERKLAAIEVAPGADVEVPVDVADLPAQSVGQATSVSIGVRWRRGDMPDTEMASPQALSQELYVTHDDGFKTAMVRDVHEERTRMLAAPTQRGSQRLTALRSLDKLGVLRAADPAIIGTSPSGLAVARTATITNVEGSQQQ